MLKRLGELMESISPVLVNSTTSSITISLSKRFLLFDLLKRVQNTIEEDPYLNFISVLKNYKILGRFLNGTIHELYRDRNKFYFKNFFVDPELYKLVKADLEWVYKQNKDLKLTITKKGIIIYDNYTKNNFNVLLLTSHAGTWMPGDIQKKQSITEKQRMLEEDIDTNRIYGGLVLKKGGIWIDNKFSRFACDFNRPPERSIYSNKQEKWIDNIWKDELTISQRKNIMANYAEFYFTLGHLIDTYRFNIIFDGHSMKDLKGRPEISLGTRYIPKFYMPVVKSMQKKLRCLGYNSVHLNNPYSGGYILKWLNKRFPDIFIFSIEVNKKLYMTKDRSRSIETKLTKLSYNINHIFDIDFEKDDICE